MNAVSQDLAVPAAKEDGHHCENSTFLIDIFPCQVKTKRLAAKRFCILKEKRNADKFGKDCQFLPR